ncbi:galactose oxidase [Cubamyces menziesii]|nr:galactose oxidase [Cubamyces menziesii]
MIRGRWSLLSKNAALARSSHCASISPSGLLVIYGGELTPRVPVDAGTGHDAAPAGSLHAIDLQHGNISRKWLTLSPSSPGGDALGHPAVPEPRVGATTVWHNDALYMWGGRGGKEMTPLDTHQAGVWKASLNLGQGSHGPVGSVRWERVFATNEDGAPTPRSYHTSVVHEGKIYIHAGCPETGRLGTLHAFDVQTRAWEALAPAPEPGRGGTGLVATAVAGSNRALLLRYGGFCGHELPTAAGTLDIYSIAENQWHTIQPAPDLAYGSPGPRSVYGFSPFQSRSPALADAVAILYHGERDASSLGHAGAGTFWHDVWLLMRTGGDDDILSGWAWRKVEIANGDGHTPEGRGWFAPASWVDPDGNTRVVLFGGLLSSNTRSDELWELQLD